MSKFWEEYPQMMEELTTVKRIMKDNIQGSEKYFEQSILPMIDGGGKMLRPAFVLLAGKFGEYEQKKLQNIAAVIEMLHMSTLIHDDIIDESKLRRGCETIQSKYGKEYAVYMGDYLFCQCFMMLSKYEYTMENLRDISKTISKICMGEIRQYHLRYAKNLAFRNYIRVISGKTAALFSISFYVGANESKCNEKTAKILGKIGYYIGMAFQIIDDLLDYSGDAGQLGKTPQNDIKRGYYTLPLIYAMERDQEKQIAKLLDSPSMSDEVINQIIRLVNQYDGVHRAKMLADRYTEKAFGHIQKLPDCESKQILKAIVCKLLRRDY